MKPHTLLTNLLLAATAASAGDTTPEAAINAKAAFERLKGLVGEWQADTNGRKTRLIYSLVAGGNSLLERETADDRPEMLTVYYLDGNRLLLTHYCMAGNQPRMQARHFDAKTGELQFQFLDATNLPSSGAGHMRNATIRFVDQDHLSSDWEYFQNGQRRNMESASYTRVR